MIHDERDDEYARGQAPNLTVEGERNVGGLFVSLREQVEDHARNAVSAYLREIPEYHDIANLSDERDHQASMYDFAVFIRSRRLDLAPARLPLNDDDLSTISSVGRQRAELGLSVLSQQRVLGLHTHLTLQEIHQVAGPEDSDELLRMLGWIGAQSVRARRAYLHGYTDGVGRSRTLATRNELLARALLADEPVEPRPADPLRPLVAARYAVSVLRFPAPAVPEQARSAVVNALAAGSLVAWLSCGELVILTPGTVDRTVALQQVRSAVAMLGRACQIASVEGVTGRLAESLAWAREASRVAPMENRPARLYVLADLFVEMAVANTPEIDAWLRAFARRLSNGPDLVSTLHAYYRNNMNRAAASAALRIHPRTLDYRLQRARKVTGLEPGSTLGVRMLSTAVARLLAR
ncbi:PucR family transcriptional regulator [Nonomuraea sp. CA-143628]|uniref:PucR family transcriptional regulator n=1 Tax=Nonomuraea sp. CA-143628 TaxID=3239997 RepID=UPI003D93524E